MTQNQPDKDWRVGARVSRTDCEQLGTIVETGNIKVQWDNGCTSYLLGGKPANVQLVTSQA
jgi:hypothetical protein